VFGIERDLGFLPSGQNPPFGGVLLASKTRNPKWISKLEKGFPSLEIPNPIHKNSSLL
jgi:hypothetical protein